MSADAALIAALHEWHIELATCSRLPVHNSRLNAASRLAKSSNATLGLLLATPWEETASALEGVIDTVF